MLGGRLSGAQGLGFVAEDFVSSCWDFGDVEVCGFEFILPVNSPLG